MSGEWIEGRIAEKFQGAMLTRGTRLCEEWDELAQRDFERPVKRKEGLTTALASRFL